MKAALVLVALAACGFDGLPPLIDAPEFDAAENDAAEIDAGDGPSSDASDAPDAWIPDGLPPDAPPIDASDASPIDAPLIDAPLIDAPLIDAPSCLGQIRCTADTAEQCNASGQWVALPACTNYCAVGGCISPPSCSSIGNCAGGSCCQGRYVPGGTYFRSYDGVSNLDMTHPATISPFVLERFEVSVNRFRRFVATYPGSLPAAGAGRNLHVAADPGWDVAWTAAMPATKSALEAAVTTCAGATYTVTTSASDDLPVNCVTWYLAQAFCIWDGGRLPSEAEWNLAAAGAAEQRVYPWSSPPTSTAIDATRATYASAGPAPVGARPAGAGRWGHLDLAGNVSEWLADWYRTPYATTGCDDCQDLTVAIARAVRGGYYGSSSGAVTASQRSSTAPTTASSATGFRCLHDR